MSRFLRRFRKSFRYGEKGFTLIELLIVVAVLGALAAVVVPAVGAFLGTANKTAANTEVANVKTAAMSYLADVGRFPEGDAAITIPYPTTAAAATYATNLLVTGGYVSAAPDGEYAFSDTSGQITVGTAGTGITSAFTFSVANQSWE